jgi:translation initiation factor IF-1
MVQDISTGARDDLHKASEEHVSLIKNRNTGRGRERMTKEGGLECDRHVTPDDQGGFTGILDNTAEILAKRGGNMLRQRIRVVPGDRVRVSLAPTSRVDGSSFATMTLQTGST